MQPELKSGKTPWHQFFGYQNILLIDAKGNMRLSVHEGKDCLSLKQEGCLPRQ